LYLFFIEKKKYQYFILSFFLILVEPIIFFSGQRAVFYLSLILIANFYIFIRIDKKIMLTSFVIFLNNIYLKNKYRAILNYKFFRFLSWIFNFLIIIFAS
jgi:hypothetical protein